MPLLNNHNELEEVEIQLLLEGVFRHYGFDFRDYAPASLRRRIKGLIQAEQLSSVSALQERVLHDPGCLERFLVGISVNVSGMFRDPSFFLAFRTKAIPLLRTYPFIRVWHAGCSTGEEVYSMAILFKEEGLYDRCRIYATDSNETILRKAKTGFYPAALMGKYLEDYLKAGGKRSLSEFYTEGYNNAIFHSSLKQNIIFSQHNLVSDRSFNEFNVILCRNVLIYFNRPLQERVHDLLFQSLVPFGILALGSKESLRLTPHEEQYEELDSREKIYRRIP